MNKHQLAALKDRVLGRKPVSLAARLWSERVAREIAKSPPVLTGLLTGGKK